MRSINSSICFKGRLIALKLLALKLAIKSLLASKTLIEGYSPTGGLLIPKCS